MTADTTNRNWMVAIRNFVAGVAGTDLAVTVQASGVVGPKLIHDRASYPQP